MFYIVECKDRILVLETTPVLEDGRLSDEFVEFFFGKGQAGHESAEQDIVEITGPYVEAEITSRNSISTIRSDDEFTRIGYDPDAGWTQ